MIITSLSLNNIRSYESAELSFQQGTTLLTGDIGSGKTSLLLALEFALFGILRGKTSPSEFLAHHASQGSVTLRCIINEQEVSITRHLKKTSSGIMQTPGELIVNGQKETLVATELKARVLSLLGYPESLINKSTNLFRYTVFTPQEQVKTILFETTEERKDVVRKIFSLDTYKLVADNTSYYLTSLRERTQRLKGQTDDVKTLKEQLVASKKRQDSFATTLPVLEQKVTKANQHHEQSKTALKKIQEAQQARKQLQSTYALACKEEESIKERLGIYQTQLTRYEKQLQDYKQESLPKETISETQLEEALLSIAEKKSLLQQKYGGITAANKQARALIDKIEALQTCPVCQQNVSSDHKTHIKQEQDKVLVANAQREKKLKELEEKILAKEKQLQLKREELRKIKQQQELITRRQKEHEQLQKDVATTKTLQQQLTAQLTAAQKKQQELALQLEQTKEIDATKEQQAVMDAEQALRAITATYQETKGQASVVAEQVLTLEKTIQEKQAIEKEIIKLSSIRTWLTELFLPLVHTIEKNVLLKVYQEFNAYFSQWFDALLADDTISVKLDEDFTPIITQHGYDTHVQNLSGGEKTSVALAYRLALHKVLNDYFSSLHTTGLLVLDEPTDGFSTEQLDRLRDVLHEVGVAQLIIVSHEQKLESLAQHIIRIHKTGQFSQIQTI